MSFPRCKFCKYWGPDSESDSTAGVILKEFNSPKFIPDRYEPFTPDGFMYEYDEGGRMYTGPEFGCVNHELKP